MRERRADAERRAGRFIVLAPLSMLKHSRPVSPERLPRVREDVAAGRRARSLSPLRMCRSMPDMSSMSTFPAERMRHSFHASASNSFSSADAVEQSLTQGLPGAPPAPPRARAVHSQPCRSQHNNESRAGAGAGLPARGAAAYCANLAAVAPTIPVSRPWHLCGWTERIPRGNPAK